MTCYHPLKAWKPLSTADGGRFVFDATKALNPSSPTRLPCGQCRGCREDRVSGWAVRIMHEAAMHEHNCFVTLTFKPEAVPQNGSVSLRDVQMFMRRLRKRFGKGIRFYAVGEYGEKGGLPHYHLILMGFWFPDAVYMCTRDGNRVFKSEALSELWPHGLHEIGSVTIQSAGYCAQYAQKKITGKPADDHYARVSLVDGQVYNVAPEFATMSRMPGLGVSWFNKFAGDVFPSDEVIVSGRRRKVPRFYVKLLARGEVAKVGEMHTGHALTDFAAQPSQRVKRRRVLKGARPEARANSTPERLAVREFIHVERLKRLVRSL